MSLLGWAITALVLAFIAGGIGFSDVGRQQAIVARWLFGIFAAAFLMLAIVIMLRGGMGVH